MKENTGLNFVVKEMILKINEDEMTMDADAVDLLLGQLFDCCENLTRLTMYGPRKNLNYFHLLARAKGSSLLLHSSRETDSFSDSL